MLLIFQNGQGARRMRELPSSASQFTSSAEDPPIASEGSLSRNAES
jgi:hypothetical protein